MTFLHPNLANPNWAAFYGRELIRIPSTRSKSKGGSDTSSVNELALSQNGHQTKSYMWVVEPIVLEEDQ